MTHRATWLALALVGLWAPGSAHADDAGLRLASPWRPESAESAAPSPASETEARYEPVLVEHHGAPPALPPPPHVPGPSFDLYATTLVPLALGGAMHFEMWEGIFVRVSGSVVIPAYVDAINDVGQSYGIWDDATSSSISELLVDSIVIDAAVGIRPLNGPIELSVAYFMLWSEGPGPRALGMQEQIMSVTVYAVHGELALRIPLGDALVMRLGLGWVHSVGRDVTLRAAEGESDEARAERTVVQTMLGEWISQYGMGPTVTAGLGIHFE